jgi:hypothetical protein
MPQPGFEHRPGTGGQRSELVESRSGEFGVAAHASGSGQPTCRRNPLRHDRSRFLGCTGAGQIRQQLGNLGSIHAYPQIEAVE